MQARATTIPYDGPNRYEILHLIDRFNVAHHGVDQIQTVGLNTSDLAKIEALATFEKERKLKNTVLDSELDTMIKDLHDIRNIGVTDDLVNIDWERMSVGVKKLTELVEYNRKKFAGVRAQREKDVEKEQQRRMLEMYHQQKVKKEAQEAKEVAATRGEVKQKKTEDKRKQPERQAQTARLQEKFPHVFKKAKEIEERKAKENKSAPKLPARLEVPGKAAVTITPGKQNRPVSPNKPNRPRSPNHQKPQANPNKANDSNRVVVANKPVNHNRPGSSKNQNQPPGHVKQNQTVTPNKPNNPNVPKNPGNQNQPISPKNNNAQESPKKLQKNKAKSSEDLKHQRHNLPTEIKEERMKAAHEVGLRLASEVRKFD